MAEYLAPGVYVEETSFRSKSIEGVGTSTTAFVGPTLKGPLFGGTDGLGGVPEVITSYNEFERLYGGFDVLDFATKAAQPNYIAHSVRAYFDNGGARLYFARVYLATAAGAGFASSDDITVGAVKCKFAARFPGTGYNGSIVIAPKVTASGDKLRRNAPVGTLLRAAGATPKHFTKGDDGKWKEVGAANAAGLSDDDAALANVSIVTLRAEATDLSGTVVLYDDLGLHKSHPRFLGTVLAKTPTRRADALSAPYFLDGADKVGDDPVNLLNALVDLTKPVESERARRFAIAKGTDGAVPTKQAYVEPFNVLEQLDDIAIVAAPGSSEYADTDLRDALITHAERCRYRVAVLDTPKDRTPGTAREDRAKHDSKYAALYYPWLVVSNPLARPGDESVPQELALPPSGFLCGIYARTDIQRGVWKAPANETVRGPLRLEREITRGEQEVLNPEGVNCVRYFPGRGIRVWGARTISSDPEWKYVSVRRYFVYLEHSIDRSTQWAVFEPNGEALWANITATVSDYLYNEWKSGALLGSKPEEAFFVRCDRSTMTQSDLDNGRLICLIGVAALKPAEFVIFRIGQKTADART